MSLSTYQRELAAMIAHPERRRRIAADPQGTLARLRLSRRERARLESFSRDPGMAVNTMLYRANRLSPIYNALPLTCAALGAALNDLLHRYWNSREIEDLQFPHEAGRFAAFLRKDAQAPLDAARGLAALLAYELAVQDLSYLPRRAIRARSKPPVLRAILHPLIRVVRFDADAARIFEIVEREAPLPPDLPAAACAVLVDRRDDPGRREVIDDAEAAALLLYAAPQEHGAPAWDRLAARGLIVEA